MGRPRYEIRRQHSKGAVHVILHSLGRFLPVPTSSYIGSILLKKSVKSRFGCGEPKKRPIEAPLREFWSSSTSAMTQLAPSLAHSGRDLSSRGFTRTRSPVMWDHAEIIWLAPSAKTKLPSPEVLASYGGASGR